VRTSCIQLVLSLSSLSRVRARIASVRALASIAFVIVTGADESSAQDGGRTSLADLVKAFDADAATGAGAGAGESSACDGRRTSSGRPEGKKVSTEFSMMETSESVQHEVKRLERRSGEGKPEKCRKLPRRRALRAPRHVDFDREPHLIRRAQRFTQAYAGLRRLSVLR